MRFVAFAATAVLVSACSDDERLNPLTQSAHFGTQPLIFAPQLDHFELYFTQFLLLLLPLPLNLFQQLDPLLCFSELLFAMLVSFQRIRVPL